MPKQLKYQRSEEEVGKLKEAMKSSDAKKARRATMLYGLHRGKSPQEVAADHQVALSTVYDTVKRYEAHAIQGLESVLIPGRPPALDKKQQAQLIQIVESDPREMGYGFSIWTGKRLQMYIQEHWGVEITEDTVRNTLKRMGYVFRRPKKSLKHIQDADAVAAFQDLLPELKKGRKTGILGYSLWTKPDSN